MTLKLGAVLVGGVITFVSLLSPAGRGEKISRERDRKHSSRLLLVLLFLYCVPTVATNSQTFALTFDPDTTPLTSPPPTSPPPRSPPARVAASLYQTSSAVSLPDVYRAQPLLHGLLGRLGTSPVTLRLLSLAEFSTLQ